jgi:hypothetical protein
MKIRIEGTPRGVEAFAAFLRATIDVRQESQDYDNRPPSTLVRRYIDAELLAEPGSAPSPLALAEDAKRLRDMGAEITILQRADTDLNSQPWLPLRAGDIVLQSFADHPDLSATYLAIPDDSREGAYLQQISSNYPTPETGPMPFYDLWFEAGRDALSVIRAGAVVFGRPQPITVLQATGVVFGKGQGTAAD